jgi:hypothetical protein
MHIGAGYCTTPRGEWSISSTDDIGWSRLRDVRFDPKADKRERNWIVR